MNVLSRVATHIVVCLLELDGALLEICSGEECAALNACFVHRRRYFDRARPAHVGLAVPCNIVSQFCNLSFRVVSKPSLMYSV